MTKEAMLKEMFLELGQVDLKAIGRSRGFDPQTMASPQLMQHVFLSEQGVAAALASLSEAEFLGLHVLNCVQDEVGLEFFRKMYPDSTPRNPFYGTYTEQFKALFQQVKTQLIRRGLLLFGTLTELQSAGAVLERRRFRFPEVFASLLPAPFKVSKLNTDAAPQYRRELLRQKVTEILTGPAASSAKAASEEGRWRLAEGELLFGGQPFRVERLEAWRARQFDVGRRLCEQGPPEGPVASAAAHLCLVPAARGRMAGPQRAIAPVEDGPDGSQSARTAGRLRSRLPMGLPGKGRTGGGVLLPFAATSRRRGRLGPRSLPGCSG